MVIIHFLCEKLYYSTDNKLKVFLYCLDYNAYENKCFYLDLFHKAVKVNLIYGYIICIVGSNSLPKTVRKRADKNKFTFKYKTIAIRIILSRFIAELQQSEL